MLSIDAIIFIGFLILNLTLGLMSSRGVKNIKEYAIGDRNFSTITIAATIVATWIGGDNLFSSLSETHANGLYFIWSIIMGDVTCFLTIGLFFAPRLAEFLGKLSVAEAMGSLYGKHVRVITAIAGFIGAGGSIAVQLKLAGLLFNYCFGIDSIYGIFIAGTIIILYSTLGGIKSVTFTDLIQLFTFGTIIPTLAYFILKTLDINIIENLSSNELFDYKEVFDFSQPKALYYLFFFFFWAIPGFDPAIFQRITMAKNTTQVKRAFVIAGITCLFISLIMALISILILSTQPDIQPEDTLKYILFGYSSYTGLKGLVLAGIMAMVMSTADSYINSTSVLISHDFCHTLGIRPIKDELIFSRVTSLIVGVFSIMLALRSGSLLDLIIATSMLYMPIVTVPFIMALLGFRTSSKSVLIGMGAGFSVLVIWEMFLKNGDIEGLIPGMVANLVFLVGSHYLLKQPGGWVGIKNPRPLIIARQERRESWRRFIQSIKTFDIVKICTKNSLRGEGLIALFGVFIMISVFSNTYTLPRNLQQQYSYLLDIFYPAILFISTSFISYPLWLPAWKKVSSVSIFFNITTFLVLVCFSFLMVIISNFAEIQLMIFMVNIILISVLMCWRLALFFIFSGVIFTSIIYNYYLASKLPSEILAFSEFKIIYLLLLISSIIMIFLRPKQEYQEITEQRAHHLGQQVNYSNKELEKSLQIRNEFLRNLEHEAHTPITGITSMGQVLYENYDKLSKEQVYSGLEEIAKSSERLSSLVDNLIDLSKLSSLSYKLNKTDTNLSELVYDRLNYCKKLYLNGKELEFLTKIENNVMLSCDKYYIKTALDNLIINAIQYSKEGAITIELSNKNDLVEFIIQDEGIGIPQSELFDIFYSFKVSSKTKTPAGGRGIGLALCERVAAVHGGSIKAESDGKKGARFVFVLPQGT